MQKVIRKEKGPPRFIASRAAAAALTGAGSLDNPLLKGSVFDTVSSQPQRKRVTTTDS